MLKKCAEILPAHDDAIIFTIGQLRWAREWLEMFLDTVQIMFKSFPGEGHRTPFPLERYSFECSSPPPPPLHQRKSWSKLWRVVVVEQGSRGSAAGIVGQPETIHSTVLRVHYKQHCFDQQIFVSCVFYRGSCQNLNNDSVWIVIFYLFTVHDIMSSAIISTLYSNSPRHLKFCFVCTLRFNKQLYNNLISCL